MTKDISFVSEYSAVLGRIVIFERIGIPNSICFAIWNEYEYRILFVNTEIIRIYLNSLKYLNTNTNSVKSCIIGTLRCFYRVIKKEGVKNIYLYLQNYLNHKNISYIPESLRTGHLCWCVFLAYFYIFVSFLNQVSFFWLFPKSQLFQSSAMFTNDFFSLDPARNKYRFNILVQSQSLPKVSITSHAQCISVQFLTLAQMFKYLILAL